MLTRRSVLLPSASIAPGWNESDHVQPEQTLFAKAAQPATPVNFEFPPMPAIATPISIPILQNFRSLQAASIRRSWRRRGDGGTAQGTAMERVVIVTPSVYGTDNSATLFGMKARARPRARRRDRRQDAGSRSRRHGKAGFRGIRINLATGGASDPTVGGQRFQAASSG